MTTTWLWFVLAGFLLGFTVSTLWEWFHFRQERMKAAGQRVRELEAKLREMETQVTPEPEDQPAVTPRYRSPGVFLEGEESAGIVSNAAPALPKPAPAASEPANHETVIVTPAHRRTASQPFQPPEGRPARGEPLSVRRPSEMRALAARREALRRGPHDESAPTAPEPAHPCPSWRDNPDLTRRSQEHPDNLSKIRGIGDVYRQRLYRAGIYTWHQVATSDINRLRQATNAYPSANVEEWPSQALQLAERHGRVNAVYTGPPPDELTRIVGIGPVSAQTLYRAGICTFEQLAMTPVDELAALFPIAVAGDQPDFAHWIAQAAALADAKHKD